MEGLKGKIIGTVLAGTLALGSTGIDIKLNNISILDTQNKIKSLVKEILLNSVSDKLYNPMNPDGIETDDGYIYIVRNNNSDTVNKG